MIEQLGGFESSIGEAVDEFGMSIIVVLGAGVVGLCVFWKSHSYLQLIVGMLV